jgi:hypothetical protein
MAFVGAAHAQIIGIDFNNGGAANQSPASTDVVGPVASSGWYNNVDLSAAPGPMSLLDNNNTATGATFAFKQGGNTLGGNPIYNSGYGATGSSNGSLTPTQQLYNGAAYAANAGFSQELTLSNIPYSQFDVYLLVQALPGGSFVNGYGSVQLFNGVSAGTAYWFSYQNASFGPPAPTPTSPYVQATGTTFATATDSANYVRFSGLTGGLGSNYSFDLTSPGVSYNNGAYISAVQIVAAVPEPSTCMLALCGIAVLFGLRGMKHRPA